MMLTDQLASQLFFISDQIRARPALATAALVASISLVPTIRYVLQSYRGYIAIGPGGLPHNAFGWLVQGLLQAAASWDTISLTPFTSLSATGTERYGPHGRTSFLNDAAPSTSASASPPLPRRAGARPTVPGYVAPQRQTTGRAAPATHERMDAFLQRLAAANPGPLAARPSGLEGAGTPALFLADGVAVPRFMARTRGEICHAHGEGSAHAVLGLADAEEVVRKGWAERHRFSGRLGVPLGYLMIYAPRDEGELMVWRRLVLASVRFVCAAAGAGEVVVPEERGRCRTLNRSTSWDSASRIRT